jgi:outer membrane protein OmpA-like peptidoglycan-associated protein
VHTDVIPVPIMFVYNEATLTTDGRRAADLLLEYLTLKRLNSVELSGHADERGSDDYNFEPSRKFCATAATLAI